MPTFDVTIDGKIYHVEIPDPGASPLRVVVDGQSFEVGVIGTETRVPPAPLAPAPPPAPQPVDLPSPPRVALARPADTGESGMQGEVFAPMPGTILSVAVQVGEHLDAGTVLCILEAMKMKNPIRITHDATVLEVAVQPGQTVAYGDLLVRTT